MIESGTAMLGIIVAHALRKNRKITMTTSATVNSMVISISLTDARIVVVRLKLVPLAAPPRRPCNSAVRKRGVAPILDPSGHCGNVAEPDRGPVSISHDQRRIL